MSYLTPESSITQYGVVKVGGNINVANGVISIPQNINTNASVIFGNVTDSALTSGRITFASTGGLLADSANLTFDPTTNTLSVTNLAVTNNANIVNANVSGNLTLNGNSVITSVTPSAGNGISITNLVSNGPDASFTVNNTGVTGLTAGDGITLSGNVGNVTISSSGADLLSTTVVTANYTANANVEYIGVNSANLITITLPTGITGRQYIIKDEYGTGFGTIDVVGTGGQLIDGGSPYSLLIPYSSISVVFRGSEWHVI